MNIIYIISVLTVSFAVSGNRTYAVYNIKSSNIFDNKYKNEQPYVIESPVSHHNIIDPSIIKGDSINIESVPYQAVLLEASAKGPIPYCNAVIISRSYLLTSGHCLVKFQPKYVGVGHKTLKHVRKFQVSKFNHHPKFKEIESCPKNFATCITYYKNDIGYIFLRRRLPITKQIKPIPLIATKLPSNGSSGYVSGWGATADQREDEPMSRDLQGLRIDIFSFNQCIHLQHLPALIPKATFCSQRYGDYGVSTGDSGSPVTVNKELAGIVSFGWMDRDFLKTGAYTNIMYYKKWICTVTHVGCDKESPKHFPLRAY